MINGDHDAVCASLGARMETNEGNVKKAVPVLVSCAESLALVSLSIFHGALVVAGLGYAGRRRSR